MPPSQRCRSTSAQRLLQNGRNFSAAGLRQIGQQLARALSSLTVMASIPPMMWWRATPASHRAEPAETDGVALPRQQRRHFVEREPHDIAVGADDLDDEAAGNSLRGIAPGFSAPFAGCQI